jgi:RNA polymerase sigma-70 factor (ECF subfamily)
LQAKQKQHDIELFRLIQAGDEHAFAQARDQYYHTIYLNSFIILNDRAEAEDVAQEVFIELWNKKNLIHIESNLSGYLTKAAYNRSLNILSRKQKSVRRELIYSEGTGTVIEQPTPTIYDELLDNLKEAIKDLPEMSRRSIEMVYWEKRSHKEVAEITGLSINTIKTQIYNSLKIMRSKLRLK